MQYLQRAKDPTGPMLITGSNTYTYWNIVQVFWRLVQGSFPCVRRERDSPIRTDRCREAMGGVAAQPAIHSPTGDVFRFSSELAGARVVDAVGAQDSRLTTCVGKVTLRAGRSGRMMRSRSNSASLLPISSVKTWTEVRGGCSTKASQVSLKPATLRSSGILKPRSRAAL